ncbi:MAG: flippase-like domain-containing protein [Tardiphaga sp.]|nr:flippase-like domain-containing protein [Tardiphaga sp.]
MVLPSRQPVARPDPAGAAPVVRSGNWRYWFVGIVAVAALAGAVLHFGEIRNFMALVEKAQPLWLLVALVFQLATYASVASGWRAVLLRAGSPQKLWPLLRLAVSKLFLDQALPTAGMGGNVLVVDRLIGLGVSRGIAVAALLVSMIGFYGAYMAFALLSLLLLWAEGKASPLMVGVVTTFVIVATAIPSLALWLRRRGRRPLPPWLEDIGAVRRLLDAFALAPAALLKDRNLLFRVTLFNALVFLLDAATLYACLRALGQDVGFSAALIALVMASVAVTLGPIPLGLGSFEIVCTATLHLLGVAIEAALTGTMLLRMMILWLPLLPGLFLMRGTMRQGR